LFTLLIRAHRLLAPIREYRFESTRRWRFDFTWPAVSGAAASSVAFGRLAVTIGAGDSRKIVRNTTLRVGRVEGTQIYQQ
jgi:hypothetical protein